MSPAEDVSKVIERIQKLRRLTGSTNVHEAAAAAGEAQRLMTEHRIAEAQIAAETGAQDEIVTDVDVLAATGMRTPQSWLVQLASGVARANGCRITVKSSSRRGRHCEGIAGEINMYGRPSDLAGAKYLFFAMRNEIERLADGWTLANPGQGRGATISFKLGAAVEIGRRMLDAKEAQGAALKAAASLGSPGAGGALMVINRAEAAVEAAVNEVARGCRSITGPSSYGAYSAGREAGSTVSLGGGKKLGQAPRQIGGRP